MTIEPLNDSSECDHPSDAIMWNPWNMAIQCHRCGQVMPHPLNDGNRAYADRLAEFIIDHIGKPYTADECGQVLEIRGR